MSTAQADNILRIRAFSNADKSRVVLDLDYKPKYSTAYADKGDSFIIRLNDVTNYKSAPNALSIEKRSVIKGFSKNLSGNDVRYIFSLAGAGTPNVFVLEPMNGQNYRLVVDFPHTASDRNPSSNEEVKVLSQKDASKLVGTGQGAGLPPVNVITIDDADAAENSLLNSLSSVGSDGIRTMTPEQVQTYQERIEQINAQKEAQAALANKNKNNQTTAKRPAQVEEEVLDTQAPPPPLTPVVLPTANPYVIAIDAGHGGKDPGAIGKRGVKEKNVTLAVATQLAKYVNSNPRFKGTLIRSKDVFVDLDKRSEIARSHKADILISIHADSVASGSSARGASVWVLSNNRAQRENSKVLKGDKGQLLSGVSEVLSSTDKQNPYLAATILSMSSDNTRSEGYNMGQEILNKLGKFTKLHKKEPIHASLAVLKSPDIPSLLIETGFLSNPYEEIQLNQPNYQKQIAYSIYQGIVAYYEKYTIQHIKSRYESAIRTGAAKVVIHEVQKGESLSVIAQKYKKTVSSIKQHNRLTSDNIRIGQKLVIQ
ncbi:N-acetylmuramoyl-L-alanine amidase [Anaerobiospirillum sp. NML120448]|uniref:N-acetylmuramoyl-L-alanine amidase n=1 Tax=Anaerobiospirillum sp. NML120448 TaxID=2932816 RepID=UPI001FF1B99A|nr:N-acetylmuramoyl-L-alanine amidase [Anaerobiospirillum sp. NML120448]MCK0513641.1 N-acetylmuramoyl-L-alanine amidase [Anaerobiospirillum sp. NML120448]